MTGVQLSRVLRDFGQPATVGAPEPDAEAPTALLPIAPCEDRMAERLNEARTSGEEAGRSAARAEHERELAEARANAEDRLAEARRQWVEEQGDVLAAGLTSALAALEDRIAGPVARILTPFLTDRLRDAMVQDLSESVTRLVSRGRFGRLRISGPDDLLAGLRGRLGPCPAAIEWVPDDRADIALIVDETTIETDIASWIGRFEGTAR